MKGDLKVRKFHIPSLKYGEYRPNPVYLLIPLSVLGLILKWASYYSIKGAFAFWIGLCVLTFIIDIVLFLALPWYQLRRDRMDNFTIGMIVGFSVAFLMAAGFGTIWSMDKGTKARQQIESINKRYGITLIDHNFDSLDGKPTIIWAGDNRKCTAQIEKLQDKWYIKHGTVICSNGLLLSKEQLQDESK